MFCCENVRNAPEWFSTMETRGSGWERAAAGSGPARLAPRNPQRLCALRGLGTANAPGRSRCWHNASYCTAIAPLEGRRASNRVPQERPSATLAARGTLLGQRWARDGGCCVRRSSSHLSPWLQPQQLKKPPLKSLSHLFFFFFSSPPSFLKTRNNLRQPRAGAAPSRWGTGRARRPSRGWGQTPRGVGSSRRCLKPFAAWPPSGEVSQEADAGLFASRIGDPCHV